MLVQDVMTKNVVAVRPGTPLAEAATIMETNRFHALPVVEEGNTLVGIVTETDFFTKDAYSLHLPSYMNFLEKTGAAKAVSGDQKDMLTSLLTASVKEIMTPEPITVTPETPVAELMALFTSRKLQTVPVISEGERLVGIVAIHDVLKFLGTRQAATALGDLAKLE